MDGRTGFTGGVGIADLWHGDAQDAQHWRDTHFRVSGPVVAPLQAAFLHNWIIATGHALHGTGYLPPLEPAGGQAAQVFTSAPVGGAESVQRMYLVSIAAARWRGVRVQMIVPGAYIDRPILRHASRFEWGPLLRAGVETHEYQPTLFHCKVDGRRRGLGVGRLDQLRQPLFQPQRRGQPEHPRPCVRTCPGGDLRCRLEPVTPRHAGRVGEPAVERQAARRAGAAC